MNSQLINLYNQLQASKGLSLNQPYSIGYKPKKNKDKGAFTMKKTKSMIYRPSEESRELTLYAENTGELYRRYIVPVIQCLHKKYVKGTFNIEKSIPLWYNIATEASKMYTREFGYGFTVTDRYTAACDLAESFLDNIKEGID